MSKDISTGKKATDFAEAVKGLLGLNAMISAIGHFNPRSSLSVIGSYEKSFDSKSNVDVYTNAPLIGFLYGRTADLDDLKNPETGQIYNQNVMGDRVIYSGDELQYNFWLIMLLDANYEPDEEKRIDKAFRHYGQDPADEERFDSYVRGGIDVLYEKLVEGDSTPEAFANRLYEFIDEFNDRFNSEISSNDILQLCVNKS